MTTTTDRPGTLTEHGAPRLSALHLVRSEWIKLWSVRSTIWTLAIFVVATIGLVVLITLAFTASPADAGPGDVGDLALVTFTPAVVFAQVALVVLGALTITSEYSTGSIRSSLAAAPRRLGFLWSKGFVLAAVIFVLSVVVVFASAWLQRLIFEDDGFSIDLGSSQHLRALIGTALYLATMALLAFAFGALMRHSAAAIASLLGLLLVLPIVFSAIPWHPLQVINVFLPGNAGTAPHEHRLPDRGVRGDQPRPAVARRVAGLRGARRLAGRRPRSRSDPAAASGRLSEQRTLDEGRDPWGSRPSSSLGHTPAIPRDLGWAWPSPSPADRHEGDAMDPAIADVERQVALLLRLADRNRRRSRRLEGTLERSAYLALGRLIDEGPAGINEIADHLRLDASTVTRQVLQMEAAGYVTRGRDEADARRSVIAPTPDGVAAWQETRRARGDVYAEVLSAWTPQDLQVLAHSLTCLNASLDASLDAAARPAPADAAAAPGDRP